MIVFDLYSSANSTIIPPSKDNVLVVVGNPFSLRVNKWQTSARFSCRRKFFLTVV